MAERDTFAGIPDPHKIEHYVPDVDLNALRPIAQNQELNDVQTGETGETGDTARFVPMGTTQTEYYHGLTPDTPFGPVNLGGEMVAGESIEPEQGSMRLPADR